MDAGYGLHTRGTPGFCASVPPSSNPPKGWHDVKRTTDPSPNVGDRKTKVPPQITFRVVDKVCTHNQGRCTLDGDIDEFPKAHRENFPIPHVGLNESETKVLLTFEDGITLKIKREHAGQDSVEGILVRRLMRVLPKTEDEGTDDVRVEVLDCTACDGKDTEIKTLKRAAKTESAKLKKAIKERDEAIKERDEAVEEKEALALTNNTLVEQAEHVALFNALDDAKFESYTDIPKTEDEIKNMPGSAAFVRASTKSRALTKELEDVNAPEYLLDAVKDVLPPDAAADGKHLLTNLFKYVTRETSEPALGREIVHAVTHNHCQKHRRILSIGAHAKLSKLARAGSHTLHPLFDYNMGFRGGGWATAAPPGPQGTNEMGHGAVHEGVQWDNLNTRHMHMSHRAMPQASCEGEAPWVPCDRHWTASDRMTHHDTFGVMRRHPFDDEPALGLMTLITSHENHCTSS